MPRAQPRFEEVDGLRVPLGGVNGYKGVRGGQGGAADAGRAPQRVEKAPYCDGPGGARAGGRAGLEGQGRDAGP